MFDVTDHADAIYSIADRFRTNPSNFVGIDAEICKMIKLDDVVPFSRDVTAISNLVREVFESWGVHVDLGIIECRDGYLAMASNDCGVSADVFEAISDTPAHAMMIGLFFKLEEELVDIEMNA